MRQFIGSLRDDSSVRDLLVSVAPSPIRAAAAALDKAEMAMLEVDEEPAQWRTRSRWRTGRMSADTTTRRSGRLHGGGGRHTVRAGTVAPVSTLSGGEQKRLVLEALLRGPDEVLLLDEPDNYLDVPAKRWLEEQLIASPKTVLFISHDRELLDRVATRVATLEPGAVGSSLWVHPGRFSTYHQARIDRNSRLEELRRRWDEERAKLVALVLMYKTKSAFNDGLASRYHAAQTRLAKFEALVRPSWCRRSSSHDEAQGGRTAKRAVTAKALGLTGHCPGEGPPAGWAGMEPFDLEIWYGERVAVLGGNGSGKSHFLRLLAAGGSDPAPEHRPVGDVQPKPVEHSGVVRLGSRVRPGWFAQTHQHPALLGRTLLEILHRGDDHRAGKPREEAAGRWTVMGLPVLRSRPSTRCREASRRASRSCFSS
jgi:ATPase subunit of ABC transporter with duplicated ATPase domains